jgi:hypothetical protein
MADREMRLTPLVVQLDVFARVQQLDSKLH